MGKKIVVIGGGTGISNLLRGLKRYTGEITAIVTMTDDGGGSGMIRKELGLLPPGDVRNCLAALANQSPVMEELLRYRFTEGALEGQNFGNLLIVALNNIYGSFERAIKEVSSVLNITGRVLPVTLEHAHLVAEFENGEKCIGESRIPIACEKLGTRIRRMDMFPEPPLGYEACYSAISAADVILLGPGSLFTSVIPNLLVRGISEAIYDSKAKVYLVVNSMNQRGETDGFTVGDHIRALEAHSFPGILTGCLVNTKTPPKELLEKYRRESGAFPVSFPPEEERALRDRGMELFLGDFLEEDSPFIRHDPEKVCKVLPCFR